MTRRFLLAMALLAATASQAAVDDVQSFRVRVPVQPAPGASVQRLVLPATALLAIQRADLGDVRVFDRTGRRLPIALVDPARIPAESRRVALRVYPILGSRGTLRITGLSMKLDSDRVGHVVGVDGVVDAATAANAVLLGSLLNTRDVAVPVLGLALDVDLPVSQPVTFKIEQSADLADWETVAQKVIYRVADRPAAADTIALDRLDLRGKYLRVTWSAASRLLSPVTIRSATLITPGAALPRIVVAATTPPSADPYRFEFALPFGPRLAALRIVPPVGTFMIPVKLFGRADREQPWSLLAEANVFQVVKDGRARSNGAIELPDGAFREMKIEADKRSGGFPAAPGLELNFAARQVAVLLAGKRPFTLAAGSAAAPDVYLPLQTLVPDGRVESVPLAIVTSDRGASVALPSSPDNSWRTILLWAALLVGTLSLGAIVWALYRSMRRQTGA